MRHLGPIEARGPYALAHCMILRAPVMVSLHRRSDSAHLLASTSSDIHAPQLGVVGNDQGSTASMGHRYYSIPACCLQLPTASTRPAAPSFDAALHLRAMLLHPSATRMLPTCSIVSVGLLERVSHATSILPHCSTCLHRRSFDPSTCEPTAACHSRTTWRRQLHERRCIHHRAR